MRLRAHNPNETSCRFCAALTYMPYKGFHISTRQHLPGHWHAHVTRDGVGFSTLPNDRRLETEAWEDGKRKVDEVISAAESVDESMEGVWQKTN